MNGGKKQLAKNESYKPLHLNSHIFQPVCQTELHNNFFCRIIIYLFIYF